MTVALLDVDVLVYKACFVTGVDVNWGDGVVSKVANKREATDCIDFLIRQWREKARGTKYYCCLSHPENFRKHLDEQYKANRKDKPELVEEVRKYVLDNHPTIMHPGLEADDVLGIYSGKWPGALMVSPDKDMQSVPGILLNPDKSTRPVKISKAQANRFWTRQILTGDSTDNFHGIPGVGPKKAERILLGATTFDEAWERIVRAYVANGLSENDAIRNARLARILRTEDWNPETGEIRLWHPLATSLWWAPTTKSSDPPTTTSDESKSSTSPSKSADTIRETKRRSSKTSSSTSAAPRTKGLRKKTSSKPKRTSKSSSNS